ncbi:hypothetical protein UM93_15305 [Psychromicrobium lacuslunae]|uniref:Acyl-CoA dehydrogenase n=2 Tax=Psychromicrobium lacuslunae TaxID=1618207 RepID=A0A0D4C1I4_9MICC|nr:hypothetical protein UM93_15305 [Psychromicrobium lacuslunae]
MGEQRLLAPWFPLEFGGRALGQIEAVMVLNALGMVSVVDTLYVTSLQVVGNVLLDHASAQLQQEFLPELASGRLSASVLYSEKGAGSDLLGIRTRGEKADSDGWLVSGEKCWSARTPLASHALCAFQTEKSPSNPYSGFTLGLIDLSDPGVALQEEPTLSDEAFYRVSLDKVLIPSARMVGGTGEAWPIISSSISYERTGMDYLTRATRWLDSADGFVDTNRLQRLRDRIAAAYFLAYRTADEVDRGGRDDRDAALVKLVASELAQESAYLIAEAGLAAHPAILEAPGLTISAGPSEMLVDMIANQIPESAVGGTL